MRIAYVSDLHTDLSERNAALLDALVARGQELRPDVLVLAGDVAETLGAVGQTLRRLAGIPALRLYLAGNHDLFVEGDPQRAETPTSLDKFERRLPAVATDAGFAYLGLEPVHHGGVAFVGVPGWYDFSLRDPALDVVIGMSAYRAGIWRGTRAYDRGHVFWPRAGGAPVAGEHPAASGNTWAGDESICATMCARLASQLESVRDATNVVGIVHMLPCLDLVQRRLFGDSPFFDAYLGSARLGESFERAGNVRVVLSGHLHRVAELEARGMRGLASPVGDARKSPLALEDLARERLGVVEV